MSKHLVIGLGSIGSRHKRILEELGEEVRVADINIPADWRGIDMVWICTPPQVHHDDIFLALNKGIYIFCEKPLTDDSKVLEEIEQRAKEKNAKIFVACNMRFHPCVQLVRENLPKIGDILYGRFSFAHFLPYQRPNWQESYVMRAGIVLDCIHELDLALWFNGPSKEIQGFASNIELPIHDYSRMYVYHENKVISEIALDFLRRDKMRQIEIVGKEGTLHWSSHGKNPSADYLALHYRGTSEVLYNGTVEPDEMYRNQIKHILTNKPDNLAEHIKILKTAMEATVAHG